MRKNILAVIFVSIFLSGLLLAQDANDFPSITAQDIPGGTINRESIFDGNGLWGHIDGGADVYLEYGFDKLLFQDITWKSNSFRVEFYRMIDSESAFGIFSISKYKCSRKDTLTKWICVTPFQVQAAVGKYYITLVNDKGTEEAEQLTVNLFEKILSKQEIKLFDLPDTFAGEHILKNREKVKFVKGDLGLQNGFPVWQEMFSSYKHYNIYILPADSDKSYSYLAKVKFESASDAARLINSLGITMNASKEYFSYETEKELKEVKLISDKEFYYYETNGKKSYLDKF